MACQHRRLCVLLSVALLTLHTADTSEASTNVALNKPATQNSYHPTFGRPEKVVDGIKDTNINYCTHTADTDSDPVRWWRVDLEGLFQIDSVVITNRGDCCGDRLADFDINVDWYLSDSTQSRQDSSTVCLHHSGQVAQGDTVSLKCAQSTVGRYVTLTTALMPLNLCEMEVLGEPRVLVSRADAYRRQSGKKAAGDIIREVYAKSVIQCTSTCAKEQGCTAVNLQRASAVSGGGRRQCQLLAYDREDSHLSTVEGWDLYILNAATTSLVSC